MGEEDEDAAVAILLQLLDDLLIYDAGSLFEKEIPRPTKEDLEGLGQDENVVTILKVLRKYVRPRNEVLRIRRTVNAALAEGNVGNNNVYSRYLEAQQKLAALKDEKARLQEKLQSITGKPQNFADVRGAMMGEIYVQKLKKQLRVLKIYHKHLKLLHSEREQIDKQTTLSRTRELSSLLSPSTLECEESSKDSGQDLSETRSALLKSLQSSNPKHILQSLTFLTSLSTQSLRKSTPVSPTKTETSEIEVSLLPIKQHLIATAQKLSTLESKINALPKKEYATTEAKCRALKAARTEALDRLDELVSSVDVDPVSQEWSEDVNAAKEIIDERVKRIKMLVEKYYEIRGDVEDLRVEAGAHAKKIAQDPRISAFLKAEVPKDMEWKTTVAAPRDKLNSDTVTLSQLEAVLDAKWKIETAQMMHASTNSALSAGLEGLNELFYNICLESPLLRDADILSAKSVPIMWRDASLRRTAEFKETIMKKIKESEEDIKLTESHLEEIHVLEREAEALETLFDNVL